MSLSLAEIAAIKQFSWWTINDIGPNGQPCTTYHIRGCREPLTHCPKCRQQMPWFTIIDNLLIAENSLQYTGPMQSGIYECFNFDWKYNRMSAQLVCLYNFEGELYVHNGHHWARINETHMEGHVWFRKREYCRHRHKLKSKGPRVLTCWSEWNMHGINNSHLTKRGYILRRILEENEYNQLNLNR